MRAGAVIIFEDTTGRVALQLRDDRPEVAFANHWGLFGGWMEPSEAPRQCIRREVMEELGLTLDATELEYLRLYVEDEIGAHVFRCAAPEALHTATLREGQRWAFWRISELTGLHLVPRHQHILEWFAARRERLAP